MQTIDSKQFESLDVEQPIWSRFFMVAPLAVIGTREATGYDMAPKHMLTPMGFGNYVGFVCSPDHGTYQNIRKWGEFTVSFPRPDQTFIAALGASPRREDIAKPQQVVAHLPTLKAIETDALFLDGSYLMLECDHFKTVDGFQRNSLITGTIRKAFVRKEYLRVSESDEGRMIRDNPLLAYIAEGRFSRISETYAFPFPKGFKR